MSGKHSSYEQIARTRRGSAGYREGYDEARRVFLIAVRERRLALGLSQTELAARAGMTQPALSRLEAGGVVPTLPLLDRIAAALDADLTVTLPPRRLSTATVGAVPPERQLANSGGTCPTRWRVRRATYREVPLDRAAFRGEPPTAQRLWGSSGGSTPPLPTDQGPNTCVLPATQPTTACCIAHSIAAARVDTPILV